MTPLLSLILFALAQPEPAPQPAAPCPLEAPRGTDPATLRCFSEAGPNWRFVFAFPAEAPRIPSLEREIGARLDYSRRDFESVRAYAAKHRDREFFHEELFVLDADRPELLAFSSLTEQYAGGAHPWYATDVLIWDRAADREIGLHDLFDDPATARAEIDRALCPALLDVRRRRSKRSGGSFAGGCEGAPEEAGLAAGDDGRIDTLRVRYAELEGYAGGEYEVFVPVTTRLIEAMKPRFRPAFRPSGAPALGCNTNLIDPACRVRQRQ